MKLMNAHRPQSPFLGAGLGRIRSWFYSSRIEDSPQPAAGSFNTKGMSLTELMVVLAIVAITAAIAIPMYISDLPRQKAKAAAQGVMMDLRLARAKAVAGNQVYLVCFDSTTSYKLGTETLGSTMDCGAITVEKTVDFTKSYKGVQFGVGNSGSNVCEGATNTNAIYFPSNTARFNNRGSSVDGSNAFWGGGAVYLTNTQDSRQQTYCVQVDGTTGRAKLWRWDTGDLTWK